MITGLVLAGGESRRMGHDKALIMLGDTPAYLAMANMLLLFCDQVFVSCREDQQLTFGDNPNIVGLFDRPTHAGRGPMSGILSFLNHTSGKPLFPPQSDLLLLGCDYRNMTEETLERLVAVGQTQQRICCYQNHITGITEPLVAYFPANCLQELYAFGSTQSSVKQFVDTHNACILPTDIQTLKTLRSFDQ